MKRKRNWVIGLVLATATAITVLTTVSAPDAEPPVTQSSEITEAPSSSQGNCGYQWAYHDAPELTQSFDGAVKALDSKASGRVEFYGEDCVYTDGTSTFSAMETDFHVRLQVEDLDKEEDFGNWVAQVMEIVIQIPREELSGNYGFVEFWFEKNETEHIVFRVPIQQYINEAQGRSGAELFKMYYEQP